MVEAGKMANHQEGVFGLWSMPRSAWTALPSISLPTAAELALRADPVGEREAAERRRSVFDVPVSERTVHLLLD
jgi:hypothetical protein